MHRTPLLSLFVAAGLAGSMPASAADTTCPELTLGGSVRGAAERALVDVGWPSVGVKLTCAWVSLGVYAWTLVAPALFPDRVF